MNLLGIMPGQRVADVGGGLGYYIVRLARRLGRGATIYATDVKAEYLDQLKARLKRKQLIWFEHSAHNIPFEEPEVFNETVVSVIRSNAIRLRPP
jgi:ubiquinone/menaquinone biosynthesis C-methylase UbiE